MTKTRTRTRAVWKFELQQEEEQTIIVPRRYSILSVGVQDGKIMLWVEVTPEQQHMKSLVIEVVETGQPLSEKKDTGHSFIGTVQLHGGALVLHVYLQVFTGSVSAMGRYYERHDL